MFQKILFHVFILGIFSFGFSYADFKNEDTGRKIAELYLESNKNDDFWKDNSPRLGESTPLYMEKETPSYVEYQVICARDIDCGYIIVNVDGDDVQVPTSSPSDIAPTQILTRKSEVSKENLQFFYFGIFDVYVKNKITGQIHSIDPQFDPKIEDDVFESLTKEEQLQVKNLIIKQKQKVPEIFQKKLQDWKEYKQTEKFQEYKKQIIGSNGGYTIQSPGTEVKNGWKYVKGQSSSDCNSRIPCYEQYSYWYNGTYCASGCSPVAAAMIFGYYDKEKIYPNLFPGILAPMTNTSGSWFWQDATMKNAIDEIRGYMGTECDNGQGGTYRNRVQDGIKFAKNHGYSSSYSQYVNTYLSSPVSWIFTDEINAGRPLILHITGHDVVLYGYSLSNNYNVRINAGWGNGEYSNKNVNILGMTLGGTYYNTAGFTKFIIQ